MAKKIIVPIGLNLQTKKHTQDILTTATEVANALNWKIIIFHSFTVPLAPPNKEGGAYISHATESKEQKQQIKELLNDVSGIDSVLDEIIIEQGGAQELICEIARKKDVSMILLGTKARHGLESKLLGSISEYVIHHAHCPVLVVPEKTGAGTPQRINLLVDEHHVKDMRQLDLLTALANALIPKLMVTYVNETKENTEELEIYKYLQKQSAECVQTSCESLIESDSEGTKRLLDYWSRDKKILITMPFHQEGFLEQLFTPGLITKLINQTPSPMLILK